MAEQITGQQPIAPVTPGAVEPTPASGQPRADGVTFLAIYHFLLAGIFLLLTLGVALPAAITAIVGVTEDPEALIATGILGVIAMVSMAFCILLLSVGYGLWTQRQWARIATLAIALLSLPIVPIGTLLGGVTLWYLLKPEVAGQFR